MFPSIRAGCRVIYCDRQCVHLDYEIRNIFSHILLSISISGDPIMLIFPS